MTSISGKKEHGIKDGSFDIKQLGPQVLRLTRVRFGVDFYGAR